MSKIEGGIPIDPPPPSRLSVTIFSSRLLGLKQCQRNTQISGGSMRRSQNNAHGISCGTIFTRFKFSRFSLALTLKYYPILHVVKR